MSTRRRARTDLRRMGGGCRRRKIISVVGRKLSLIKCCFHLPCCIMEFVHPIRVLHFSAVLQCCTHYLVCKKKRRRWSRIEIYQNGLFSILTVFVRMWYSIARSQFSERFSFEKENENENEWLTLSLCASLVVRFFDRHMKSISKSSPASFCKNWRA
jgi:hypothetical protein